MNLKKLFIYDGENTKSGFEIEPPAPHENDNAGVNGYIKNNIRDKTSHTYKTGTVSPNLCENLEFVRDAFELSKNFDLVLREFEVKFADRSCDAFLIFYDGLANAEYINRDILNPLMVSGLDEKIGNSKIEDAVYRRMISQAPNDAQTEMRTIIELVEFGNCAVFVDGCSAAFVADVKGWDGRGVEKPVTEATLSGPQEAFNEKIMTNIGLIRKILKDANLIAEKIAVGSKSKTPCALMYINGITNQSLVAEARRRLCGTELEYVFSSADVEMLIEDSALFPLPQLIKTERPDRAAAQLADGKAVIIVQGSPFVLVLPATATDLLEASEDSYIRVAEANMMRIVRVLGLALALLLPGIFAATVLFHHESIPTDLLLAIEASREKMPFPIVAELLLMLAAFELIKEASVRVPDPIGSTLGIVGGLILGQAAVEANIAGPLLIIVVSISALGSFAAPSLALSRAVSLFRLVFVLLGAAAGFSGISFGIFAAAVCLAHGKSFGVPYLSGSLFGGSGALIKPMWKREIRPRNLRTQRKRKQPHISRRWKESVWRRR